MKLLRTLQSGEVRPVGSDIVKTVDVRVVTATNVDLRAAIAAGTFRQDLFYRLNVIAVRLPALRERGDDILLLAHHFIQKHAQLAGRPATRLSHEAAVLLQRYDWPGNVRELEHAIEHAVVLSEGDVIQARALPAEVQRLDESGMPASPPSVVSSVPSVSSPSSSVASNRPSSSSSRAALAAAASDFAPPQGPRTMDALVETLGLAGMGYPDAKKRVLAEFNDAYVGALLASTSGNMSEAARRSGLDRSNFRRLVRTTSVDGAPSGSAPSSSGDDDT